MFHSRRVQVDTVSLSPLIHPLHGDKLIRIGGGDNAMLDQIFGARPGQSEATTAVSRLSANEVDGALAMAVGLAANESFKTGKLVKIDELLGVEL